MRTFRFLAALVAWLPAAPVFAHGGLTDAPAWLISAHEFAHAVMRQPAVLMALELCAFGTLGWWLATRPAHRRRRK